MNKHSPEPWKKTCDEGCTAMLDDLAGPPRTNSIFCESWGDKVHFIADGVSSVDARRIVACVNACKGIDTTVLEAISKGKGNLLVRLTKENDNA